MSDFRAPRFVLAVAVLLAVALAPTTTTAETPCADSCGRYGDATRLAREAAAAPRREPESAISAACPATCGTYTWLAKARVPPISLAAQGVEGGAAGVVNGKIYVGHGYTGAADTIALRIYDIASDTWDAFGPDARTMGERSEGVGAVADGKLWSIGGRGFRFIEAFDPVTGLWVTPSPALMPTGRKGMAVGVINGKIHVVGGSTGSSPHTGTPMTTHEVYDPATNTWDTTRAPLPVALLDVYAAVARGSKLYVFGGFDGLSVVDTTHIYDEPTDSWSLGAPMPTPRSNAVAGELCGLMWVVGGLGSGAVASLDVAEGYDPVTDTWCTGPAKPTGTSEACAGLISTGTAVHVIGSGPSGLSSDTHEALTTVLSCLVPTLARITNLKGFGLHPVGSDFQWDADPNAVKYHLTSVSDKRQINDPQARLPPPGIATPQCIAPATICSDPDVTGDPPLMYYQVFSACDNDGDSEGPI